MTVAMTMVMTMALAIITDMTPVTTLCLENLGLGLSCFPACMCNPIVNSSFGSQASAINSRLHYNG